MKIFVTGSSGFIGFHLSLKLLNKGHKVHGLDSMNNYYDIKLKKDRLKILKSFKGFSFTKSKLENKKNLNKVIKKFKPKVIIHLAAQAGVRYSIKQPEIYLNSNIVGTFNIIESSQGPLASSLLPCIVTIFPPSAAQAAAIDLAVEPPPRNFNVDLLGEIPILLQAEIKPIPSVFVVFQTPFIRVN